MSEDQKKRQRRGRPAKNPDKKMKTRSGSVSSSGIPEIDPKQDRSKYHSRMLEAYDELAQSFLRDGISQQSQHLIRKIIHSPFVPELAKLQPLLIIFNTLTQELLMNELEIVVLSIYLEKFVWSDDSTPLPNLLRFVGYAVKHYLCEDLNPINAYLANKYQGFLEDFSIWQERYKAYMSVNPKDLNDKFKELSKAVSVPGDTKIMDYNYYVDEILQILPMAISEKQPIEELTKDPEVIAVYAAFKNKAKIITKESEDEYLPILNKLDSVLSGVHDLELVHGGNASLSHTLLKKIDSNCDVILNQSDEEKEEDDII